MFAADTLTELRDSLAIAEEEREGGISPHVSPFVGIGDVASLMSGAGFNLITIDAEKITARFRDPFVLMHDLQCMGENNAVSMRRETIKKETLFAASTIYQQKFGDPTDGSMPATFHIVYMIGWAPGPGQPQPKKRGSQQFSLRDLASVVGNAPSSVGIIEESEDADASLHSPIK